MLMIGTGFSRSGQGLMLVQAQALETRFVCPDTFSDEWAEFFAQMAHDGKLHTITPLPPLQMVDPAVITKAQHLLMKSFRQTRRGVYMVSISDLHVIKRLMDSSQKFTRYIAAEELSSYLAYLDDSKLLRSVPNEDCVQKVM